MWGKFREFHYLSHELNKAATIYVCYWDELLVAMCAVLPMPSGSMKHAFRPTRTVVLPDYQNLGIGTRLSEFVGDYYLSKGYRFYYKSTHLRLRYYFDKSPFWVATKHNGKNSYPNTNMANNTLAKQRHCGSYEYKGKRYTLQHVDICVEDTEQIDLSLFESDMKWLLEQNYYITIITGNVNEDNRIELICQKLGIRTNLLYYRGKLAKIYRNENIVNCWDANFSNTLHEQYKKKR